VELFFFAWRRLLSFDHCSQEVQFNKTIARIIFIIPDNNVTAEATCICQGVFVNLPEQLIRPAAAHRLFHP
jgi:hypothetical protein